MQFSSIGTDFKDDDTTSGDGKSRHDGDEDEADFYIEEAEPEDWQVLEDHWYNEMAIEAASAAMAYDSDDDSDFESMDINDYLATVMNTGNITEQLFRMCQELCMWKQLPSMNTQHIDPVMVFQHFVDVFYEYESYVDVNRPNSQLPHNTMLMVACGAGHIPLARFLLENGADIHLEDHDGATALIHAIRSESEPMVKYLLDIAQPDIHRRNSGGFNGANTALCTKQWSILELLHEYGCPSVHFEAENDACDPLLLSLIMRLCVDEMEKVLFLSHWNVNTTNTNGRTLLMTECLYPSSESLLRIQALIQYSSLNLDMKDKDGNTALIFACQSGRLDLVELLLTAAATENINLNAQNLNGESAMIVAASRGYVDIVQALAKTGKVDSSLRTKSGLTASAYAIIGGFHQKYLDMID